MRVCEARHTPVAVVSLSLRPFYRGRFHVRPIDIARTAGAPRAYSDVAPGQGPAVVAVRCMPLARRRRLVWQTGGARRLLPWASPAQPQYPKLDATGRRRPAVTHFWPGLKLRTAPFLKNCCSRLRRPTYGWPKGKLDACRAAIKRGVCVCNRAAFWLGG